MVRACLVEPDDAEAGGALAGDLDQVAPGRDRAIGDGVDGEGVSEAIGEVARGLRVAWFAVLRRASSGSHQRG